MYDDFRAPAADEMGYGVTGMRVILNENTAPNAPSDEGCGEYAKGETQDYLIYLDRPTGVNVSKDLSGLIINPNPVHDRMNALLYSEIDAEVNVSVVDVRGAVIQKTSQPVTVGENRLQFDLNDIASGLYILKVETPDGGMIVSKFSVE